MSKSFDASLGISMNKITIAHDRTPDFVYVKALWGLSHLYRYFEYLYNKHNIQSSALDGLLAPSCPRVDILSSHTGSFHILCWPSAFNSLPSLSLNKKKMYTIYVILSLILSSNTVPRICLLILITCNHNKDYSQTIFSFAMLKMFRMSSKSFPLV